MQRILATAALAVLLAAPAAAQNDPTKPVQGSGTLPAGWRARVDGTGDLTKVKFETMAPGWHVTLGPAAIFYRAADTASGSFDAVAKFFLFPGASHPEGYGILIGGSDLQGAAQAYTYFLVRSDGKFLIKRRKGDATTKVADWTANAAVKAADSTGHAENELSVQVKDGKVSFMANGKEVYSAPAADLDTKGVVGLRVNHNLSVHVAKLEVHRM